MDMFLDLLPNQPRNEARGKSFRDSLRQELENRLADSVERIWELPPMLERPRGEYLPLLLEARALYVAGYFYSSVAMCGIVGKRLAKDALRACVLVQKGISTHVPSEKAFDQFERV